MSKLAYPGYEKVLSLFLFLSHNSSFEFECLPKVNVMLATEFGLTESSGVYLKGHFLRQLLSVHFSAPLSRELVR